MPKFVFLWTDFVLWLVVAGVVVYIWRVRHNARTRANWLHVLRDAPAMCAAVVLGVFITIALLDSVHFRPRLAAIEGAAADAQAAYATRTRLDLRRIDVARDRSRARKPTRRRWPIGRFKRKRRSSTARKCAAIRAWPMAART